MVYKYGNTWLRWQKNYLKKLVELDVTMNLKDQYYQSELEKCIFLVARLCKQVIWKSGAHGIYISLLFCIEICLI